MKKLATTALVLALSAFGMGQVSPAAAVELRFTPQDQNIALNGTGSLAIWLDDPIEVRTLEVTVSFNDGVLSPLDGGPGEAFEDLSCYVWQEYQAEAGQWYGFAVSMGSDCFVVGPGELFTWSFEGIANGTSAIDVVAVTLFDRFGVEIEDVTLPGTAVSVGDGVVPAGDFPGARPAFISASPNPCNPMTNIKFWLPEARRARLGVYDLKGRRVRTLLEGSVPAEWTTVRWDGRTDRGQAAPSGVYLYRLETGVENLTGRLTLAR
jgi:hypothetical protein